MLKLPLFKKKLFPSNSASLSSSPKADDAKQMSKQKRLTLDLKSPNEGGHDTDFSESAILSLDNEFREKIRVSCSMPRFAREFVQIGSLVGKGNSGSVVKAVNLEDYKVYALKRIYAGGSKKSANRSQLLKELQTFSVIRSPYLVGNYGTIVPERGADDDDEHVTIVLEYMNRGSLQNVIENYGAVQDEKILQRISKMVLLGLKDMHNHNHIHRDMKPGNIVLNHKGQAKVTDFGIAKMLSNKDAKTFVGTHIYMSPERIEQKQYSFAADIWGFGLSMMTLAMGKFPYEGVSSGGFAYLFYALTQCPAPKLSEGTFSKEFSDFLSKCLQHDPTERWSAAQLLEHPFLRDVDISVTSESNFRWPWEQDAGELSERDLSDLKDAVDVLMQVCQRSPGKPKLSTHSKIMAKSLCETLGIPYSTAEQVFAEEMLVALPCGRTRSAAVCHKEN